MRSIGGLILALLTSNSLLAAEPAASATLPKVVLLGDSIRGSYAPIVAEQLAGQAVVVSHKANGGDSANELRNLDVWAIREQPDIVHLNCGIHDTKQNLKSGQFQVPPEQYEANLRKIVERLRKETKAKVVFALTTPILDDRAAASRGDRDYKLTDAAIDQYNEIAMRVMKELDVPVDDLPAALGDADETARVITPDGVHYTGEGREKLGKAAAKFIEQYLPAK